MSSQTESDMLPEQLPPPVTGTGNPKVSLRKAFDLWRRWRLKWWRSPWTPKSFSDIIQIVGLFVAALVLFFAAEQVRKLTEQLHANNLTNQVAIRGQLYQTEKELLTAEGGDDYQIYATIWAYVPPDVTGADYGRRLLSLITDDSKILSTSNAEALYHKTYDAASFEAAQACNLTKTRNFSKSPKKPKTSNEADDAQVCDPTKNLRRLFLYVQSNVYHMHNAFDYYRSSIINKAEWDTWKGLVGEMNAHPVLLAVIWHGYQYRYFSKMFGEYLKEEICGQDAFGTEYRKRNHERNCKFAQYYYPEMFTPTWSAKLPDYGPPLENGSKLTNGRK